MVTKNAARVNSIKETCLPFAQVPFTKKRPQKPETCIKDGFYKFSSGIFRPEKTGPENGDIL